MTSLLARLLPARLRRRGSQNHFAICKRRTMADGSRKWLILRWVERQPAPWGYPAIARPMRRGARR